jgi:hypothetical protein
VSEPQTEIADHDGVEWARWPDGRILYWSEERSDWLAWRRPSETRGAKPPDDWLVDGRAPASPVALEARRAREANEPLFQVVLDVSTTDKATFSTEVAMAGAPTPTRTTQLPTAQVLAEIEAEGWRLQHAGYAFQPTGSMSRDRFLATGQFETVVGRLVGVYLFRPS